MCRYNVFTFFLSLFILKTFGEISKTETDKIKLNVLFKIIENLIFMSETKWGIILRKIYRS